MEISKTIKLPNWITIDDKGSFIIDPDVAYPYWLNTLRAFYQNNKSKNPEWPSDESIEWCDPDQPSQYWLEVVYQCTKLDVFMYVKLLDIDPRPKNKLQLIIRGSGDYKDRWALKNHPDPDQQFDEEGHPIANTGGVYLASNSRHARKHFSRIRGESLSSIAGIHKP